MFSVDGRFDRMNHSALSSNKIFTIRDLERYTGIKAHTLRIWEQRYSLLRPQRTKTNFRFYSITDLKRVLDVSVLNRNGLKISFVSALKDEEITKRINMLTDEKVQHDLVINTLIIHMHLLDHSGFEKILNDCLLYMTVDTLLKDIIFVFLQKTGLLWQGKQLNEEHFVVTAIRNKIILGIENTVAPDKKNKKNVLLFLPEGKQLDLLLLYTNYVLKLEGMQVLFMGSDVTLSNVKDVFTIKQPEVAFTYVPHKNNFPVEEISDHMKMHAAASKLLVSVYPDKETNGQTFKNVEFLNYEDVLGQLLKLSN